MRNCRTPARALAVLTVAMLTLPPHTGWALTWTQVGTLQPPSPHRYFGGVPAFDGDTYLGAAYRDPRVYVLQRRATWVEQSTIEAPPGYANTGFGDRLDLDGDSAAIVGWQVYHDHEAAGGAAHVYVRSHDRWRHEATLKPADADLHRPQVRIDGDTVLIGAPDADDGLGAAYVFVRHRGAWARQAKLVAAGGRQAHRGFGRRLALDGGTVAVGGQVFVRSGGSWRLQAALGRTPAAVALQKDTLVLGLPGNSDPGSGPITHGSALVYIRRGSTWQRQAELLPGDYGTSPDGFGSAVAIDGDRAVVGAPLDFTQGREAGAAHVFVRRGDSWHYLTKLLPRDPRMFSHFGALVRLDGDIALLGLQVFDLARPAQILAPGAVDADGVTDLAVITPAGEVTVKSLNGSQVNRFTVPGFDELAAVRALADTDSNGAAELAVLGRRPDRLSEYRVMADTYDLLTSARLSSVSFGHGTPPYELMTLPDQSGNGIAELAASLSGGGVALAVRDALTGEIVNDIDLYRHAPADVVVLPDQNGNGSPEFAELVDKQRRDWSDVVVERDAATGEEIRTIWLGKGWEVRRLALLADRNGNGAPEVAVLRVNGDGAVNVLYRDSRTRAWLGSAGFARSYRPTHLLSIGDINGNGSDEIVVFGRDVGAVPRQRAAVKDSLTGELLNAVYFDPRFPAEDIAVCGDNDGNGAADLVMLGRRGGERRAILKDAATGERLRVVAF